MDNDCFIHFDAHGKCDDPVFVTRRTITSILPTKERT